MIDFSLGYRCVVLAFVVVFCGTVQAEEAKSAGPPDSSIAVDGDALLAEYFQRQTAQLAGDVFAGVETLEDWQQQRARRHAELREMLGLDPLPAKTPLESVVTGQLDREGITVERLHFQSMPGLYVTGTLFRPQEVRQPLPAVLYVCGHGRVKADGISYGNKASYQHHGAWFAKHGYVCLMIDTIQLGEIEGHHHGTHRYGWWWWNNRGYTPAGVEAWNSIRAIDYLQSRSEVDGQRIGITGRSGGGAYSWWAAALDERIKAAVPVAGITSMQNHVVDGCIEGHCDCMFMVNTYRWDFPLLAAMVAPRPLLISNSDKDRIFPLDGVVDVYQKVQKIYRLYDAEDQLGLNITEGPHKDTQELRVPAFRWLNRFLKADDALIRQPAEKLFAPEELRVFASLPEDERVTTIHESFVPAVSAEALPETHAALQTAAATWMEGLRTKAFAGWPNGEMPSLDIELLGSVRREGVRLRVVRFLSQEPFQLPLFILDAPEAASTDAAAGNEVTLTVLDDAGWEAFAPWASSVWPALNGEGNVPAAASDEAKPGAEWVARLRETPGQTLAWLPPRGVGPSSWTEDKRERTHIRRRFMLLGQTLDGMRVWDVRRAWQALSEVVPAPSAKRTLAGEGKAAGWALLASLFEPAVDELVLEGLPARNRDAYSILNISRVVEIPQLVAMATDRTGRVRVQVAPGSREAWEPVQAAGQRWWSDGSRLEVLPAPSASSPSP